MGAILVEVGTVLAASVGDSEDMMWTTRATGKGMVCRGQQHCNMAEPKVLDQD